jgi:hypothetical protein
MADWSLHRRTVLRAASGVSLAGLAGCSALRERGRSAIALYVVNETDAELTATLHYLDCRQVGDVQQTVGVEAGAYSSTESAIVADSGTCALEVTVPNGPSETYEWTVDRRTLVVTITPDAIEFDRRSPTYHPGE